MSAVHSVMPKNVSYFLLHCIFVEYWLTNNGMILYHQPLVSCVVAWVDLFDKLRCWCASLSLICCSFFSDCERISTFPVVRSPGSMKLKMYKMLWKGGIFLFLANGSTSAMSVPSLLQCKTGIFKFIRFGEPTHTQMYPNNTLIKLIHNF